MVVPADRPEADDQHGISTAGIHAPSVNLDTTTTSATTPVATQPTPLIDRADAASRGSRSRQWCTTMPAWLSVNPVNTPNA